LKSNFGKINYQALNSGVLSENGSAVHVGVATCSGKLSTGKKFGSLFNEFKLANLQLIRYILRNFIVLVTTDIAHNLDSGDTVFLVNKEYNVVNILADNVFSIGTLDDIPQGIFC
jgi:hypothetical protein